MNVARPKQSSLNYRPDIDGMRAVAVLSVIACHMGVHWFAGGYVGVDVFFVISGYLISSIIFAEIAASRFSVLGFYERRIRRIFPALFAMLFIFSIVATVFFFPSDLVAYCKSLLAATASSSNFWFWLHSGYFESPTSNPLLHTWSLAVEEQFYILFPIFLVIVRKFTPRRLRTAVVVLFFASLLASVIMVRYDMNTAFYMPYTRAWELLLGTILSLKMFPPLRSSWMRNFATVGGLAMVFISVFSYTAVTSFPGLSALVPCLGSALIIWAGESGSSLIASALSWRPVVFVGLISYSLYLWHWPVIILLKWGFLFDEASIVPHRIASVLTVYRYNEVVGILASFLLAIISWVLVERPFRNGPLRLTGKPLFLLSGAVVLIFAVFSVSTIIAGGFSSRFPGESLRLASNLSYQQTQKAMRYGICLVDLQDHQHFRDFNQNLCLHQKEGGNNYLLLGDSHAAMLWPALSSALPEDNFMQAGVASCAPIVNENSTPECAEMMRFIFEDYLQTHKVRALLLEARWIPKDIDGLSKTIEWAKNRHLPVVLFGPVPEYDTSVPRLLAYSVAWNDPTLPERHRTLGLDRLDSQLQSLADGTWHVPYISLYRALCNKEKCLEYADTAHKVPLMIDEDHLSTDGSLLVIHRLLNDGALKLE